MGSARGWEGCRIHTHCRGDWRWVKWAHSEDVEKKGHEENMRTVWWRRNSCADVSDAQDPKARGGVNSQPDRAGRGQGSGLPSSGPPLRPPALSIRSTRTFLTGMRQGTDVRTLQSFPLWGPALQPRLQGSSLVLRETLLLRSHWESQGLPRCVV